MDDDDLGQAVAGFRRAEVALAAIAADADRLVDARSEVEQARDELKVVAGALVGLASAHRDLVGQLGEAAAALRPAERREENRLIVALHDAEGARVRQVAEVADAVEELAHRLDRALAERVGGIVAQLRSTLPSAEQLSAVAHRLDGLATSDRLAALAERLDELPDSTQLTALADRLDGLATAARLEDVAGAVAGLARSDEVAAIGARVERLESVDDPARLLPREAGGPAHRSDFEWLVERLDAIDRLPTSDQLTAIQDLISALAATADLTRLDQLATTADLRAMELRLSESLTAPALAPAPPAPMDEVAERAATKAAQTVEGQVAQLVEQVRAGQRRVHALVLAVGVSLLLFAALISVLALQ